MTDASIVALIGSPHQALSLLEYVRESGVNKGLVFLTRQREPHRMALLYNTLAHLHGFTFLFRTPGGFLRGSPAVAARAEEIAAIARDVAPGGRLVLGDYRDTLGWRLARELDVSGPNFVVLDDGAVTLAVDRTDGGVGPFEWSDEAERGGFLPLPEVTFFTAYSRQLRSAPNDIVIPNAWEWIRSRYAELPRSDSLVLLIGQGMAAVKLVEEDVEIELAQALVRTARSIHPDKTPLYVAHRGESQPKLDALSSECEVVRFDLPIELVPVQADVLPAGIVGNYSTALTSFAAIAPSEVPIHAVRLPLDRFLTKSEYIAGIYAQLESAYAGEITVIDPVSQT